MPFFGDEKGRFRLVVGTLPFRNEGSLSTNSAHFLIAQMAWLLYASNELRNGDRRRAGPLGELGSSPIH